MGLLDLSFFVMIALAHRHPGRFGVFFRGPWPRGEVPAPFIVEAFPPPFALSLSRHFNTFVFPLSIFFRNFFFRHLFFRELFFRNFFILFAVLSIFSLAGEDTTMGVLSGDPTHNEQA